MVFLGQTYLAQGRKVKNVFAPFNLFFGKLTIPLHYVWDVIFVTLQWSIMMFKKHSNAWKFMVKFKNI